MTLSRLTFSVTIDGIEREVVVGYNVIPAHHGQRDSYGQPLEPDERAHVEVVEYLCGGRDIESQLTERQKRDIERECEGNEGVV